MVVRVKTGRSIRRALSYNERKLSAGKAELLLASNFPVDDQLLGFTAKMKRFQSLIDRNPKVKTNALHISLNFPPDEQLSQERMTEIAMEYMEKIGFDRQPFLVYKHNDAAHPHIHIVTTNLKRFGRPLKLHNLAKEKSEPARKAIEKEFGLIPAESRSRQNWFGTDLSPWPANYGKEETKHAITNIVGMVLSSYKFANLDELNAVLGQYRIAAHRGSPRSRMFQTGGLIYQLQDITGARTGIPIKASSIAGQPTLKNLEKRFAKGSVQKLGSQASVKRAIEGCLNRARQGGTLSDILEKQDIGLVIQRNATGSIEKAVFIDHRRKAVFSASELGIRPDDLIQSSPQAARNADSQSSDKPKERETSIPFSEQISLPASTVSFIQTLLRSESDESGPPDDEAIKKRKRKRGHSL